MLKRLSFLIVIILLGAACSSKQEVQTQVIEPTTQAQSDEGVQSVDTEPEELAQVPTATPTNTPIPPTETPPPTSTPTPTVTPTPRPITHANIGWEGYDTEPRDPFPDEMRIKSEIVENNLKNELLNGIKAEDIRIVWYEAYDGTLFWRPYFTINNERVDSDLYLYIYSLTTDPNDNLTLLPFPKFLNISALERLGYIQNLTDIQLLWNERANAPVLAIEKNGLQFWYPDELQQNLVSYDQNLSVLEIGIPEMPESAGDFVTVLFAYYPQDVYLFTYDETATTSAGIGNPNDGPVYKLVNNQWQAVDPPEFIGDGTPKYAYIGYTSTEDGQLYVNELTNYQTGFEIPLNGITPLAPAAIKYEESLDYYFLLAAPVWSPNGQYIAFITEENDAPSLAIYDMEAQSWQSLTQIPQNTLSFHGPIWSPDGKWLTYAYRTSLSATSDTIRSVAFPEGQEYDIGQGCNPVWFEHESELAIQFNPNCYSNHIETSRPDGSETGIKPLIYRISAGEDVVSYVPSEEAFIVTRSNELDGSKTLLYKPINGDEEVILGELPPTEDGFYWDIYSGLVFSPDTKWIYIPIKQSDDQQIVGLYVQNLETKEEYRHEDDLGAYLGRSVTGWTPDGKGLVIGIGNNIYDATTGDLLYSSNSTDGTFNLATSPWNKNGMLNWIDTP